MKKIIFGLTALLTMASAFALTATGTVVALTADKGGNTAFGPLLLVVGAGLLIWMIWNKV